MRLLACTLVMALAISTPLGASAAPERSGPWQKAQALMTGIGKDGPRHTWQAVKEHPRIFGSLVLACGVVSAVSHAAGFNPEPLLMAAASGIFGYQLKRAL